MTEQTSVNTIDVAPDEQTGCDSSWVVSLCFWGILVIAASVYASVALAPKFCVWNEVRLEHQHNVAHMRELEESVAYLERVEAALETDPEFRDRVVGVSQAQNHGDEFLPVSGDLLFGNDQKLASITATPEMPAYHGLVVKIASQSGLRISLLIFAAGLTVFAFAFLNDAGTNFVHTTGRLIRSTAMLPVARYLTSTETRPAESDPAAQLEAER